MYYQHEYDRIVELHKEYPNVLLDTEYMKTQLFPAIGVVILAFTALFLIFYPLVSRHAPEHTALQKRKGTYQLTNFCVNLGLGVLGAYQFCYTLPSEPSFDEYIVGSEHMYPLTALQIGYQLWALPVGMWVGESPAMMAHHVSTIFVAGMAGFLTMGFRFWAPFFFGLIELSSVPLAIMNTFKDNAAWMKRWPGVYLTIRATFSFSFLYLRWIMYAPRKFAFLRHAAFVLWTSPNVWFQLYMSIVWVASVFVASLQFFWGLLILKGIVKFLFFNKKIKVTKKVNGYQD